MTDVLLGLALITAVCFLILGGATALSRAMTKPEPTPSNDDEWERLMQAVNDPQAHR